MLLHVLLILLGALVVVEAETIAYSIKYERTKSECFLEYVQLNEVLLTQAPTHCFPNGTVNLLHLLRDDRSERKYFYLEVCYYDKPAHAVTCSDSRHRPSVYKLNTCTFFTDEQFWIFASNNRTLVIGSEYGSCQIKREVGKQYEVIADKLDWAATPYKGKLNFTTLRGSTIVQFDNVGGKLFISNGTHVYYDGVENGEDEVAPIVLSEGFEYSFLLNNESAPALYQPEYVAKSAECGFNFGWEVDLAIAAVDLALLLVWILIFCLEMKGYRRMKYEEIRNNLIDQKLQAMEAIGRVLV